MQPKSPNPNYDFILNDAPKKRGKLPIPNLGLPRPVQIGVLFIIGVMFLIIVFSLISGSKKGSSQSLISLMARAQEISRVSSVAFQGTQDSNLQTLTTTVSTTMDSQEAQLSSYLKAGGQKIDPKLLSVDQNAATDTAFQAAAGNNSLPSTYTAYLRTSLNAYEAQLSDAYKKASSPQLKTILSGAYNSVQTIITGVST